MVWPKPRGAGGHLVLAVRMGFTGEPMWWNGLGDQTQLQQKEPRAKKAGFPKPAGWRSETRWSSSSGANLPPHECDPGPAELMKQEHFPKTRDVEDAGVEGCWRARRR